MRTELYPKSRELTYRTTPNASQYSLVFISITNTDTLIPLFLISNIKIALILK